MRASTRGVAVDRHREAATARAQSPRPGAERDPRRRERRRQRDHAVAEPDDDRRRRDLAAPERDAAARERDRDVVATERRGVAPPPAIREAVAPVLLGVADGAVEVEVEPGRADMALHRGGEHGRVPVLRQPRDRVRGPERAERPRRPGHDVAQRDLQTCVRAHVDRERSRIAAQHAFGAHTEAPRIGSRGPSDQRAREAAGMCRERAHPQGPCGPRQTALRAITTTPLAGWTMRQK